MIVPPNRRPRFWRACAATLAVAAAAALSILAYRSSSTVRNVAKIAAFRLRALPEDRKLILLGDSRIASLGCQFAGWRILNLGIAGSTAEQWAGMTDRYAHFVGRFEAGVVWVGINDILWTSHKTGNIGRDLVKTLYNAKQLSDRVLLLNQTVNPATSMMSPHLAEEIREVDEAVVNDPIARSVSIRFPFARKTTSELPSLFLDNIHLNDQGNRELCFELEQWLDLDR